MRSLSDTRVKFPEIYDFSLNTFDDREKANVIYAKVKSGKRLICETVSQYTNKGKDTLNFFFSGLNRKDVKVQFDELKEYNMACYVSTQINDSKQHILDMIHHVTGKGNEVVLHIDEADYGSDSTQILGSFLKEIYQLEKVTLFFYTATPWELTSAPKFMENAKVFQYTPPANYRGDKWFLDNNLVHETDEDFVCFNDAGEIMISETGIKWLKNWVNCSDKTRNWSVVRISTRTNESSQGLSSKYKLFKNSFNRTGKGRTLPQIQTAEIFPHMKFCPVFVDEEKAFHFGDYESWDGHKNNTFFKDPDSYHLIIINQTSTRSTEWAFHDKLFFYYSNESTKANITTQIQRQQRVAHYHDVGHPINVITSDVDTWLVSAGRMGIEDYISIDPKNRSIHQRTSKTDNTQKKERFFAYEGDEYITVLKPQGFQVHPRLMISKDHPELVKRRNHPGMIIPMSDGTELDLRGKDLIFEWTNQVSTHGGKSVTANANVARYVLEGKFGLSKGWYITCAWLDAPSGAKFKNEDCAKDWERLCLKFPKVDEYYKARLEDEENAPKCFAYYLPAMEQIEEPFVVTTKDKSVYSQIPVEHFVEG